MRGSFSSASSSTDASCGHTRNSFGYRLRQLGQTFGSASNEGGGVGDSAFATDDATNVAALVITLEAGANSPLDWGCGNLGPDPIARSLTRGCPGRGFEASETCVRTGGQRRGCCRIRKPVPCELSGAGIHFLGCGMPARKRNLRPDRTHGLCPVALSTPCRRASILARPLAFAQRGSQRALPVSSQARDGDIGVGCGF